MVKPDPYEGEYLEAADLIDGKPVTVTIKEMTPPNTVKAANGKMVDKWIIAFANATKKFICNPTNYRCIKVQHGKKRDDWIGKHIILGVRYGDWFGEKNLPVLRVVIPEELRTNKIRMFYGRQLPKP
jgi:hypothetical protein